MLGRLKALRAGRRPAPAPKPAPKRDPWAWERRALGASLDEICATLTEELRELRPDLPDLRLELDPQLPMFDLDIRREGDVLLLRSGARKDDRATLTFLQGRAAAPAWWLLNSEDEGARLTISLSDGDHPSLGDFSFSAHDPALTLLPDSYFFRRRGYFRLQHRAAGLAPPWDQREDGVLWRGDTNGQGLFSLNPALADHPGVKQRLRLALKAQSLSGIDARFVLRDGKDGAALAAAGLLADRVPMFSWTGRKFALDVDGFSNAWSNLLERFHMGCCVLKVDSEFGFRQWYYDRLEPFVTHVPVKADLSDLGEKLDWIRANDAQCRDIAANGQALARSLDFEGQTRWAGEVITGRGACQQP